MPRRGSHYIRSHVWGLIAVFIALTGTAIAAGGDDRRAAKSANPAKQVRKLKQTVASLTQRVAALEGKAGPTIPTSLPPSGLAGGDLSGSYPSPQIGTNAVGSLELADQVSTLRIGSGAYPGAFTGFDIGDFGIDARGPGVFNGRWSPTGGLSLEQGALSLRSGTVNLDEFVDPFIVPADQGRLSVRQSGGGNAELIVRWSDGTIDVIAIGPVD